MKKAIAEVYPNTADAILVNKYLGGRRGIWKFVAKLVLEQNKEAVLAKCKELDKVIPIL